jgi:hypothetical protein
MNFSSLYFVGKLGNMIFMELWLWMVEEEKSRFDLFVTSVGRTMQVDVQKNERKTDLGKEKFSEEELTNVGILRSG